MRGQLLSLAMAIGLGACGGGSGVAEPLYYPKRQEVKKDAAATCPPEPDTCKTAFDGPPAKIPTPAPRARQAFALAQDASNKMDAFTSVGCLERKKKAYDAAVIAIDALKTDPYSPYATYTLASVYAQSGKKKCALAMLIRLNDLGKQPDLGSAVAELKTRGKTDTSFDGMRKEADGALDAK